MWLKRFSLMLVVSTLVLIAAGGLVTSHEAGLAVPDWPLAYGRFFPPMVGNIFWEHGHRMIAAVVGVLTLILALWIHRSEKRRWLRRWAWAAFGIIMVQALLGGLTVIYLLPAPTSILHATLAQTFFCMVTALAYFLNAAAARGFSEGTVRLRLLVTVTAALLYLQLVLGAVIRHTGRGVAIHIVLALVILLLAAGLAVRAREVPSRAMGASGLALGVLAVTQFFLGLGALVFTQMLERGYAPSAAEVLFTTAHQTTGALLLGTGFLMALMVWR